MVKAVGWGILASLALLLIYLLVMGLGSGFSFALNELVRLKFWIVPLVIGFGIQIGLFSYIKNFIKMGQVEKGTVATSTAASTTAMLACCAHHLTDLLPLVGFSVATVFITRYQQWFLSAGIISNLIGIILMIRLLRKIK